MRLLHSDVTLREYARCPVVGPAELRSKSFDLCFLSASVHSGDLWRISRAFLGAWLFNSAQMSETTPNLGDLRTRLENARKEHSPRLDFWLYNGGTIAALVLTAAATLLSGNTFGHVYAGAAAVCSALAGVIIAAERTLAFGARWRFHKEMQSAYSSIINKIDFLPFRTGGRTETRADRNEYG